jgi:hypothetical protein
VIDPFQNNRLQGEQHVVDPRANCCLDYMQIENC